MSDNRDPNKRDLLVPFGAGVAIGGAGLWALVELWPLVLIGGGLALVFKGLEKSATNTEKGGNTE